MDQLEIDKKNRENYEQVEDRHNYYCLRVGELTRWAYPAIMVTLYVSFNQKMPRYQQDVYQIPAVASFLFAVAGAGLDFLQFYVMAIFTKDDVRRFLKRKKKHKDKVHPPRFLVRKDWSWRLFHAKSIATIFAAILLILHLILLSLCPERVLSRSESSASETTQT